MEIDYAFFAETAHLTPDGRVNVLGMELNTLQVQGPPWRTPAMAFILGLSLDRDECDREYCVQAELLAPDGSSIHPRTIAAIRAPASEESEFAVRVYFVAQLPEASLPQVGLCQMQVFITSSEGRRLREKCVRLRIHGLASVDHRGGPPDASAFLAEVYALCASDRMDSAGAKIYDSLDRLLIDGNFAFCDEILGLVDVGRLDPRLMDSFLTITKPAKRHLPARAGLYERVKEKLIELRGEEKTSRLIGPLA